MEGSITLTAANGTESEYSLVGVVLQHKGHVTCLIRASDGEYYHYDDDKRGRGMKEAFVLEV